MEVLKDITLPLSPSMKYNTTKHNTTKHNTRHIPYIAFLTYRWRIELSVIYWFMGIWMIDSLPIGSKSGSKGGSHSCNLSYADKYRQSIIVIHSQLALNSLSIHSHVSELSYATFVYFLSTMLLKYIFSYYCILFQLYSNY